MNAAPRWVDGRLVPAQAVVRLRDESSGPLAEHCGEPAASEPEASCYTTARIVRGRPLWPERHSRRLCRDARALGLGAVDPAAVERALCELARAAFGSGDGVVRVQVGGHAEPARLVGTPRALGPEPETWTALVADSLHPGPMPWGGAKVAGQPFASCARARARAAGVDEALLTDRDGFLVEGARSNLLVANAAGNLVAVPLARGGVAGIALELVRERVPGVVERDLRVRELFRIRELIAVNAVRGARAVVRVDGVPIGDGRRGPWARRLADALAGC